MIWIMLVIAFILGAIVMFVMFCIGYTAKNEEPVNKVRFYVARDKDGTLRLYMGKPIRREGAFVSCWKEGGKCMGLDSDLRMYGLNENDYADITWECEPLEVFVNMED
ncbi:MAG: hypothetical protein MSA30_10530 [Prevotella sp.]|nr:hypothetical protein [Prevotella sp.]MDY3897725.1 hypothetical protein [Prevotella sp.]